MAVCGNTEERRGIVLAKNYIAKSYGIITGEAVFQAEKKCRDLVIIPPHYDSYDFFSQNIREIYSRYTDLVEPFGIDECWLDVTGCEKLFGNGEAIANNIKDSVKNETGLTISVGVSYNKIFAKLGSDLKKPDAVTCIRSDEIKEKVWVLPISAIMGVGHSTERQLRRHCIKTIGDIAVCSPELLKYWFGKNGLQLWIYANGLDSTPVMPSDFSFPTKSIGHGTTTIKDLVNNDEIADVILELSQSIGTKLRSVHLRAGGVSLSLRDNKLHIKEFQGQLPYPTQNSSVISDKAKELLIKNHTWNNNIRSVTVRAINLLSDKNPLQMNFFTDFTKQQKLELLDSAIDSMREKYGEHSVYPASYFKFFTQK